MSSDAQAESAIAPTLFDAVHQPRPGHRYVVQRVTPTLVLEVYAGDDVNAARRAYNELLGISPQTIQLWALHVPDDAMRLVLERRGAS